MSIMYVVFVFVVVFGVALTGSVRGQKKAQYVIKVVDAKVVQWEKQGVSKEIMKQRVENAFQRLEYSQAYRLSRKELIAKIEFILEDVETYI